MGWENVKIETFEQFKIFITNGFSVIKGDFMDFKYTFPENNRMFWELIIQLNLKSINVYQILVKIVPEILF